MSIETVNGDHGARPFMTFSGTGRAWHGRVLVVLPDCYPSLRDGARQLRYQSKDRASVNAFNYMWAALHCSEKDLGGLPPSAAYARSMQQQARKACCRLMKTLPSAWLRLKCCFPNFVLVREIAWQGIRLLHAPTASPRRTIRKR